MGSCLRQIKPLENVPAMLHLENTLIGATMNQTFTVQGMTCGHCEKAVTKAILGLDPQARVQIDRTKNEVVVDSAQPREAIAHAIADEGYRVTA
jgi:copper chaperone